MARSIAALLRRRTINWSRRARRAPSARFTRIRILNARSDLPSELDPKCVYQIGKPGKWAILECPCGRGHQLELNLVHPGRARWRLSSSRPNKTKAPTLRPSVDYLGAKRCHFWLREGRVTWV